MGRDKREEIGIQQKLDEDRKERANKIINRKYGPRGDQKAFRNKRFGT